MIYFVIMLYQNKINIITLTPDSSLCFFYPKHRVSFFQKKMVKKFLDMTKREVQRE